MLGNFSEVRLVDAYKPVTVGTVAIGIRKSDAGLLAKVNASLAKLKASGTIAKILEKWGQKADAS
jgi:polar amino acid transport system substrate-binding protein